jgi:alpha-amylase
MLFLHVQVIKAPKYYIIKWLTDYISDYGIDGYRGDTVKHTDETVWSDFKTNVITL